MSLLTQFYGGSGGDSGVSASGSSTTVPSVSVGSSSNLSGVSNLTGAAPMYIPTTFGSASGISNIVGSTVLGINNIYLTTCNVSNANVLKSVTINGGTVGGLSWTFQGLLTGVYGSGQIAVSGGGCDIGGASNLAYFSPDLKWVYAAGVIGIQNTKLDADSVNGILINLDQGSAVSGGGSSINLSGGTAAGNGALTAAGAAAKASLVAKGWTVTLNT